MHDTAFAIGSKFFQLYSPPHPFTVVEIGSQDVNGTLRSALPARARYIGIDAAAGKNVDVAASGAALPLGDGTADMAVASSVLEHDGAFWETVVELCRITKPGGFIYISAPSNGDVHRHPEDCWRFYPDAGVALARHATKAGYDTSLVESFIADREKDMWNDFIAVFARGPAGIRTDDQLIHRQVPGNNVRVFGSDRLGRASEWTEDRRLLTAALARVRVLEEFKAGALERERWFRSRLAVAYQTLRSVRMSLNATGAPDPQLWFSLDTLTESAAQGWVVNALQPDERLQVLVYSGDTVMAETRADLPRPDLARKGFGDGAHGFKCDFLLSPSPEKIRIVARVDGQEMEISPL